MRIARTRIGTVIESERDCGSAIETELAKGIAREIDTAEDPAVVTEIEDKETTEVAAKRDRTEIGVRIVIATEIDIEIGEKKYKI